MAFLLAQDTVSGAEGKVFITRDGKNVEVAGMKNITTNAEIQSNDMAYDIVSKIVRELELDGNVAFDFILKKSGKVVLLEINPRINASLPFVRHAGCNMVYLRCKQLLGYEIPSTYELNYGLKMKKFYDTRYYV